MGRGSRAARWLRTLAVASSVACADDAIVTLGSGAPVPTLGDAGQRIRNLHEPDSTEADATLTGDLLEIVFASDRFGGVGGMDIWRAVRRSRTEPFDRPELVAEVSSAAEESSPAISPDGLTLWLASSREPGLGQMDIWRTTRAERGARWGPLENVEALNSPFDDLPGPPGQEGAWLPITSARDGERRAYLAPLRGDGALVSLATLAPPGGSIDEPFLGNDGLLLLFRGVLPAGTGDLYLAWRATVDEPFRDPAPLPTVNTADDERDPFLSADGIRLFFSSTRRDGAGLDLYATSIELPPLD